MVLAVTAWFCCQCGTSTQCGEDGSKPLYCRNKKEHDTEDDHDMYNCFKCPSMSSNVYEKERAEPPDQAELFDQAESTTEAEPADQEGISNKPE